MISKVTESNRELISARMHEINEAFKEKAYQDAIEANLSVAEAEAARDAALLIDENLESYYANIVAISELATKFHKAPYKFFLMPLDEPLFEIDANKRTITVPQAFSKNGVGVHGDHMAEVLYFRIDKYFDYQDLFTVDDIIINWQFRPANASRNAEYPVYTSYALAPDDTYDPGHIVFGWVIGNFIDKDGNSNYMTPSKGTLSFSVSFLKSEGDKYKYLFSTQTASVNINDTLILEDPSQLDSLRRPVFERLTNSRITAENMVELIDPIFRSGPIDEESGLYMGLPASANFDINNDGTESENLILQVIGRVADDGTLAYSWSGTKLASGDSVSGSGTNTYVPTQDRQPQENITYYILDEGEPVQLEGDAIAEVFADPAVTVYEAGNKFTVTESGDYLVSLQSSKHVGTESSTSGNVVSHVCSVPLAAVPKVELNVQGLTLSEDEIDNAEEVANWTFISSDAPTVTASISIDESKIWNAVEETGVRGVTAGSELGAIALKLTDQADDAGKPTAAEIAEMPANSFVRYNNEPIAVNSDNANGEGIYKVYAINRRNHTYSVSDASNELRVSLVAPVLSQVNVEMVVDDEEAENIVLIENNARTEDATIEITSTDPSRDFLLTIGDDLSHVEDMEVKVFEIYANDYELDPPVITYLKDRENNPDIPNFYEPELVEGTNNQFAFTISGDPGYFVVEITTKYHGTKHVTVTAPFNLTSSSSFDS